MRLIDADAIQIPSTYVDMFENCRNCNLLDEFQVREIIDSAPSIDICFCRECKKAHLTYDGDCKYCEEWKDEDGFLIEVYHDKNFFCGYGERRDSEKPNNSERSSE